MSASQLLAFTRSSCLSWDASSAPAAIAQAGAPEITSIESRGSTIGSKYTFSLVDGITLALDVIEIQNRPRQFVSALFDAGAKPHLLVSLTADCSVRAARQINYLPAGDALSISRLDNQMNTAGEPEWLNPPLKLPDVEVPPGIRVGMVDSGVNYLLPEINRSLARNQSGDLVGYDFWDMDTLPFDANPVGRGFRVQRHGTRTASLLLREAPGIRLVAYRYPRPDMSRMQLLVEHADQHDVHIIGMPLGSNHAQDWVVFERAARQHPHILFIVSAGNNGRDIDVSPVYPASLTLPNMLVVSSSDDFVRPASRTNWGKTSVDYLIPAENVALLDFTGQEIDASGSSYAVSRLTALAARLKMQHSEWTAQEILSELRKLVAVGDGSDAYNSALSEWVGVGYIADPLAGSEISKTRLPEVVVQSSVSDVSHALALDVFALDAQWTGGRIQSALQTVSDIYSQCSIAINDINLYAIDSADYLRDLSTGSAHTLLDSLATDELPPSRVSIVLARDTRMSEEYTGEAFGLGNTRTRPWLRYSVWLTEDVADEGIALAHELYHVLANSGEHRSFGKNLMQADTDPGSQQLTEAQCRQAISFGVDTGLLSKLK